MPVERLANEAAKDVMKTLGLSANKHDDVENIIKKAIVAAVLEVNSGCFEAVNVCCLADKDTAHKIAEEYKKKEELLISNLSSLR